MSIKIYSDKEKIIKYLDFKGISKNKFYKETGFSNGFLDSGSSFNVENLRIILDKYRDINVEWILTGNGPMLLNKYSQHEDHSSLVEESVSEYKAEKRYPLVEPKAVGGFGSANFSISERDIKDYYVVPKFQHKVVDFMIEVEGSSMYPKYNSGDVVACRMLHESTFIQWNKTHVIATKYQGILIKRIKPSERPGFYTLVSDNKDYPPFEVPVDEIDGIALVVGVIRLE